MALITAPATISFFANAPNSSAGALDGFIAPATSSNSRRSIKAMSSWSGAHPARRSVRHALLADSPWSEPTTQ
jgi:hypothetical protein